MGSNLNPDVWVVETLRVPFGRGHCLTTWEVPVQRRWFFCNIVLILNFLFFFVIVDFSASSESQCKRGAPKRGGRGASSPFPTQLFNNKHLANKQQTATAFGSPQNDQQFDTHPAEFRHISFVTIELSLIIATLGCTCICVCVRLACACVCFHTRKTKWTHGIL